MKPSESGWFREYLDQRTDKLIETFQPEDSTEETERQIYKWIQPSGLMYGYPVSVPSLDQEQIEKYEDNDRLKLILAESFLLSMYASTADKDQLKKQIIQAPGKVIQFYESLFPDLKISTKTFFGKEKGEEKIAEQLISNRLKVSGGISKNFWSSFFTNSLLFLDVFYFFRYLETHESINLIELREQLDKIRMIIVKVIAAAAHANSSIEKEEREVFNFFLLSAKLSPDKKSEARMFFENGAPLDQLNLPEMQSWLLKKYILELATLTILSDKTMEDDEKKFLENLNKQLGLSSEELDGSIIAIESFVIEHYENVHFLQARQNYKIVSERLIDTLKSVLNKNKDSLAKEFQESKELMSLLAKQKKEGLTPEEQEKVRVQIMDILKTIPAFILIALPGSFITLPILLKVLPKNVLPSAFSEDE